MKEYSAFPRAPAFLGVFYPSAEVQSVYSTAAANWAMHRMDFYEKLGEKVQWNLYKGVSCCFEKIRDAAPNKIAAVWPSTSHLTPAMI